MNTNEILDVLRNDLRDYIGGATPFAGATPLLGGIYIVAPPEDVSYPYGLMRFQNRRTSPQYHGEREEAELEVQFWARHRGEMAALEYAADLCDQAFLRYRHQATYDLMFGQERLRDSLPPGVNPTDKEVVGVRMVYTVIIWPGFLTTLASS